MITSWHWLDQMLLPLEVYNLGRLLQGLEMQELRIATILDRGQLKTPRGDGSPAGTQTRTLSKQK